jgi:hypothetical protein
MYVIVVGMSVELCLPDPLLEPSGAWTRFVTIADLCDRLALLQRTVQRRLLTDQLRIKVSSLGGVSEPGLDLKALARTYCYEKSSSCSLA